MTDKIKTSEYWDSRIMWIRETLGGCSEETARNVADVMMVLFPYGTEGIGSIRDTYNWIFHPPMSHNLEYPAYIENYADKILELFKSGG